MNELQPHIKCKKGELGENVLIPGDPARVIKISEFFENPVKVQENREYLTYKGKYKGIDVAAMSTGIGCPSTLIAMEELQNIGVKNFIRVGTCGGLKKEMKVGDLVIPTSAIKPDGEMLGHDLRNKPVEGDKELTKALMEAAREMNIPYHAGTNRTHDSFYESTGEFLKLKGQGLVSSEMECAAVFLVAKLKGARGACILVVNTYEPPEEVEKDPSIVYALSDKEAVNKSIENAIKIALEALKKLQNRKDAKK